MVDLPEPPGGSDGASSPAEDHLPAGSHPADGEQLAESAAGGAGAPGGPQLTGPPSGGTPTEHSGIGGGGDESADLTAALPPAAAAPPEAPRWAGRAGVPQPQAGGGYGDDQWIGLPPRGGWLLPTLFVLVGLALAALIGFGLWLAFHGQSPSPATSATPTASATHPPSPSASATGNPSPTGQSSAPNVVAVPQVQGDSSSAATTALQQAGFTSITSAVAPADTPGYADVPDGAVVGTNPPAGTAVDVGSTITLLIKPAAPSPSPSPSPSAS